jgi:hypothetical protein
VDPPESPKPYFHPLRTLAGEEVTLFRPHDHPWHTGLAMTSAYLSGENFRSGPTFVRDKGYVWLENQGRIKHQAWNEIRSDGSHMKEFLSWISHEEEVWIEEERGISVGEVDPVGGFWSPDLSFRLKNVRNRPLFFGSPTTEGRPAAGYGGLFRRGPRSFGGGEILATDRTEALLGVFDAIVPAALQALDSGDTDSYERIFAPTVPLSRHIFQARYYKTGVVFLAYINGHQDHFRMLGGQEGARSVTHLSELFVLADRAELPHDPDLAAERMRRVLSVARVA